MVAAQAAWHLHGVGANCLRDATRLARCNLGFPDEVQQRRLRQQMACQHRHCTVGDKQQVSHCACSCMICLRGTTQGCIGLLWSCSSRRSTRHGSTS